MKHTPERIEEEAALVWAGVHEAVLLNGTPDSLERFREKRMIGVFREDVDRTNREAGTRRRKTLATVREQLLERGCDGWVVESDVEITVPMLKCLFHIRERSGIDLAVTYQGDGRKPEYRHCTACEEDIADLLESCAEVDIRSRELLEQRRLQIRKEQMISEVELPSVELMVEQFLKPRGIRYSLCQSCTRNILEIQIVQEVWMSKAVSTETLEEDLSFVPYLIKRPDCVKRDGRGFEIIHKWDWNR